MERYVDTDTEVLEETEELTEMEAASLSAEARAIEIEHQMTDDERFSLIISIMGYVPGSITGAATRAFPKTSRT